MSLGSTAVGFNYPLWSKSSSNHSEVGVWSLRPMLAVSQFLVGQVV